MFIQHNGSNSVGIQHNGSTSVVNGNVMGNTITGFNGGMIINRQNFTNVTRIVLYEGEHEVFSGKYQNCTIEINGGINGHVTTTSSDIIVTGNVDGNIKSRSGDISITGNINGSVNAMSGDVKVGGDVANYVNTASGDISATTIYGKISTISGDVKIK